MQYCKKCGRELKNGIRFCDRCGRSVRQGHISENSKKQEQIEKLQKERLERKRRQEQREIIENRRKERRRQKRAKQNKVLLLLLGIVVAVIVIAALSFALTMKNSNVEVADTETAAIPTMQPSSEEIVTSPVVHEGDGTVELTDQFNYASFELPNKMDIPYPEVFVKEEATGTQQLNLSDEAGGGAEMIVRYEEYPGGTPSDLMKECASDFGGEIEYSLAGDNWYGITVNNDGEIKHRKYILDRENDVVAYYDFVYNEDSDYAKDYKIYIDYIDGKFDY